MECLNMCKAFEVSCPNKLNCVLCSVEVNGSLTLRECAERLGISYVRVKQIEDESLKKMRHFGADFSN